jgi:Large ribosomal RNA subunit accumulation protein YceD
MAMASTKTNSDPWRAPLGVAQIPDTGLHREIEADAQARRVIAELAGLRDVLSAQASFDVTPKSGGRFHVTGRVRARIGQVCVVTLDPIENDIDEGIDVVFAPPELIPTRIAPAEDIEEGDDAQEPDPPEPIVNGFIDLGRLATDALFLGIDPYPRKPGAVFEPRVAAADPEDHPFAALQALKGDARSPEGLKPKPK